ncbi:response regulator transcription factor [Paenibacillus cymbidii]|uniref:response regulator transcription factor n=1 Tax=Paenibacillus cymbidii TaxID=1639034 RepID=UPI001081EF19|nr:response regulator [Paenibacillus cymbidii]
MYRLLIVDDEPIIVNGLVDFFAQQEELPLEVYGAYSAEEALQLLLHNRLDIVVTDIGMPGMDGLQLQKRIVRQWPRCKVIFLTGFDEFAYVQEAMRHQGVDYVLKAEGDGAIVRAVEKAIEQTNAEMKKEELVAQAERQLRLAIPSLQKELLKSVLLEDPVSLRRLPEQFRELQLPFDARRQALLVMVRVDSYKSSSYSHYDRGLLASAIHNIAAEYLQASVSFVPAELEYGRTVWFLQPSAWPEEEGDSSAADGDGDGVGDDVWTAVISFVKGCLESIQLTCKELLGMELSFVMREQPLAWNEAGKRAEEYKGVLSHGLGMGTELLYTYRGHGQTPDPGPVHTGQWKLKLELLKRQLENGQQEAFHAVYAEIMNEAAGRGDAQALRQEIYYSLVPLFLPHVNRHFADAGCSESAVSKLTRLDAFHSWEEATAYFRDIADAIFARSMVGMEQEEHAVVQKIHRYVHDHLGDDVSLVRIGDITGHNTKYLSRLYKKITGEDLSAYIGRMKLARAQTMLKETELKMYEISAAIGFLSEPYFYRFFRKATGITPLEYRELHKVARR